MTSHGPEAMESEGSLAAHETVFCPARDADSHDGSEVCAGNRQPLVSVISTIDDIDSSHESELSAASSRCSHEEPRLSQRPAWHTTSHALQAEPPVCHDHLDCHLADGNETGSACGSSAASGSGCSRYRPPDSPPLNAHWMDVGIAFYESGGRSCVEICCQQVCLQ